MQERRDHRVANVVVLPVGVEARRRAERRIGRRRPGVPQRPGGADDGDGRQRAEAKRQAMAARRSW